MKLNDKYKEFFFESRRATSSVGKKVCVIKDEQLINFLDTLTSDEDIDEIYRLLYGILYCGGCRISEGLALKKSDFEKDSDGVWVAKITVLKKKKSFDITRDIVLEESLNSLLEKVLIKLKPQEYVFKYRRLAVGKRPTSVQISRNLAFRRIKKDIGQDIDLHSLRHSNVALLLGSGINEIEISNILEMSLKMVSNYTHVNTRKRMKGILKRG